ncbi:MAG TPA: aldo/keto reductase [Myxococcota bacterium]|nr:aldo/keto reductase [Myxococcota bacterium]
MNASTLAEPSGPMRYRRLGRSNLRVSVVGVGCWQLGGEWGKRYEQSEVDAMFARARNVGINLIDTAECYGNHEAERLVGRAVRGQRHRWHLCTKFGHRFHGHLDRTAAFDVASVRASLERSLRALGTDFIDVYYFHSGTDEQLATEGLWAYLQGEVQAGKIRHLGLSLSGKNPAVLRTQILRAVDLGVSVVQVVYSRLRPEAREEALPACAARDLGVVARVVLAQGALSGKPVLRAYPPNDLRSRLSVSDAYALQARVALIRRKEVPAGGDLAQWAIAYSLSHEAVSAAIVGCKDVAQVDANAAAASSWVRPGHPMDVA